MSCFVSGIAAQGNATQHSVCSQLERELPSQVFLPEAPTYDATIASYPFIQLRLHPSCVVRPKSAQDVATALQIIQTDNSTRFAVKGGGHNANVGFNNVENGVTIDMQSMKAVEVARGDQVVRVQAGALSQDAYDAAQKRNVTVLAGRIGVVGTAGFLTGGMLTCSSLSCTLILTLTMNFNRWRFILLPPIRLGVRLHCKLRGRSVQRGHRQRQFNITI